jgi:hypothetical protein
MKKAIQFAVLAVLAAVFVTGCKEKVTDETKKEADAIDKGLQGMPAATDPEAVDPMGSMKGGGKPGGNRGGNGP